MMTFQEAFEKLKEAGLHVRLLEERKEIMGGSHVDRSNTINTVENSFLFLPKSLDSLFSYRN
jgi:hypothetical protein